MAGCPALSAGSNYQILKLRWDAFLVLYLILEILHGVTGLDLEEDRLAIQDLAKYLHDNVCLSTYIRRKEVQ